MNNGWIKLHRSILDSSISKDSDYFAVWIRLLLKANHEDKSFIWNNTKMTCKRGQLLTSRHKLALETKIHESKIERILKYLKSEQQIEQQNMFTNRLITIKNYEIYQHKDDENEQVDEQQMNSKRTASEQQVNTNKNDKNDKNDKNTIISLEIIEQAPNLQYGNEKINKMIHLLKKEIGIDDFADSTKWSRIYGKHLVTLIEKIGPVEFRLRLDSILADDFKHQNCNSIKYLYNQIKGFIETNKPISL